MKYVLLLTGDGDVPSWGGLDEAEQAKIIERFEAFPAACAENGIEILGGEALMPGRTATTIRRSGGERVITEGPYADIYEGLGGLYILDVPSLDALLIASETLPPYDMELRPVDEME